MTEPETTLFPDLPGGQFVSDEAIAATLLKEFPISPALAGAVAEILAQVITANTEARRAWEQAGKQAEARAGARAEALLALAADLRATAKLPDFRSRWKGLEFAAAIAEKEAGKL